MILKKHKNGRPSCFNIPSHHLLKTWWCCCHCLIWYLTVWWQVPGSRGRAPMLVITRGLIIVTGVIRLECPDPSLSSQLGKNKSHASRQSIVYHNSLTRRSSKRNFWGGGPDLCFSFKIYIIYFFSKIIFEVIPTSIFPPLSYWQKIKDRSGTIAIFSWQWNWHE